MIFTLPMMFIVALVNAYVITCLWDWFIITTFALPSLTLAQAYGISLFFSYFRKDAFMATNDVIVPTKKNEDGHYDAVYHLKSSFDCLKHGWLMKAGLGLIVVPSSVLAVGKFVHHFWIVG
jgi:hypothetical protein